MVSPNLNWKQRAGKKERKKEKPRQESLSSALWKAKKKKAKKSQRRVTEEKLRELSIFNFSFIGHSVVNSNYQLPFNFFILIK